MEDRLTHIPSERGDLYSHLLIPQNASHCVVVCSSILAEFEANYHRERLLARALAAAGVAVVRFHYAGEGNSFGTRQSMTLKSMSADGRAVVSHISDFGYQKLAYVGTRLGCFVAGDLAGAHPNAPLVFWEPMENARDLIRDADRKRRISQLRHTTQSPSSDLYREEQRLDGAIDLFGYDVYPPLLDSLAACAKLTDLITNSGRPILIGRFGPAKDKDPITEQLSERGFSVEYAEFDVSEAWWYQSEHEPESGELITSTTGWLCAALRASS